MKSETGERLVNTEKRLPFLQWLTLVSCSAWLIERAINGTWVGMLFPAAMTLAMLLGIIGRKLHKPDAEGKKWFGRTEA